MINKERKSFSFRLSISVFDESEFCLQELHFLLKHSLECSRKSNHLKSVNFLSRWLRVNVRVFLAGHAYVLF